MGQPAVDRQPAPRPDLVSAERFCILHNGIGGLTVDDSVVHFQASKHTDWPCKGMPSSHVGSGFILAVDVTPLHVTVRLPEITARRVGFHLRVVKVLEPTINEASDLPCSYTSCAPRWRYVKVVTWSLTDPGRTCCGHMLPYSTTVKPRGCCSYSLNPYS